MSNNKILKIIIIVQIIVLLLVIFGIVDYYNLLRWDVLMITTTLFCISVKSKRYVWAIIFFIFGFLFNPIDNLSLSKTIWIIADISLVGILFYWLFDYFNKYHKGISFERFIESKFSNDKWVLVNYTKDLHKKFKRFVESDSDPDIIFRNRLSNNTLAVECKYRSSYWNHTRFGLGIGWDKKQGERYLGYSKKNNIQVYVAIGIGGNPKSPSDIFFVPIETIQKQYNRFIPKKVLEQYRSIPL